eukprot:m.4757 g.4757  ORF g.4757 m.4757 type:complete len:103 (+) comp11233_c0_seq1:750-1058(+)
MILVLFATVFIIADPLRHVLLDTGLWPAWMPNGMQGTEYRHHCVHENVSCLTPVGILFTTVLTYSGFLFLAVGVLWNANIIQQCKKIGMRWKELRAQAAQAK